jgi:hypothetical protein
VYTKNKLQDGPRPFASSHLVPNIRFLASSYRAIFSSTVSDLAFAAAFCDAAAEFAVVAPGSRLSSFT